MNALGNKLLGLAKDQRGGALVEYVIVVALVAAVAVGAWQTFGKHVQKNIDDADHEINTAITDKGSGEGSTE